MFTLSLTPALFPRGEGEAFERRRQPHPPVIGPGVAEGSSLPMNLSFGVPALAGPDRLKAELQARCP